jgi:hypothetical protein
MKIEIDVSDKNEGTAEPWWVIVDPKQMMKPDPYYVMIGMITGPFFSREEADQVFKSRRHHYSDRAVVYCSSGCDTIQYRKVYRDAEKKVRL